MNSLPPLVLVLMVGTGFSGWVLLNKWAGITSAWGTIIVAVAAAITLIAFNWTTLPVPPTGKQLVCALISGFALNGLGLVGYNVLISDPRFMDTNYPAISTVLFVALLTLGWIVLGDQKFDLDKTIGLVAACIAAFFLSR